MTTGSSSGEDPDADPDVIERLEAGEPPRSPEEARARAPYEQLLERIRDLDEIAPPTGWESRAVTRWSTARRKRRLGIGLGVGATTAVTVAAVLLLQPCAHPDAARLEIAVLTDPGSRHRGDAAVGDVIRARAHIDREHVDLRIYLGTKLVARCPDRARCQRDDAVMELDWRTIEAGTYQIVVLSSSSNIPAGGGTIDRDLLEARSAGAGIEIRRLPVTP